MQVVEQVNIIMPNVPSSLAKVGDKLRASNINIDAIACTEGPSHTVIHLIVDDPETAKLCLRGLGAVSSSSVIALKTRNQPGVIANIGRACAAMNINIRMIYATCYGKDSMVYIAVEDVNSAVECLKKWQKSSGKIG